MLLDLERLPDGMVLSLSQTAAVRGCSSHTIWREAKAGLLKRTPISARRWGVTVAEVKRRLRELAVGHNEQVP